jgi:hypothetical protein
VISQMEWISRNTPPPLRRRLFDTLVPIFAKYSQPDIATALREGNKGVTAQRLSTAVAKREYGSFVRILASKPTANNPVVSAAYHLRHSGVLHTALLTGRYVRNHLQGSKVTRAAGRIARVWREPKQQDVLFGLMIISQRLGGMQSRLGEMEARLESIEDRIADLGAPAGPVSGVDEQGRNGSATLQSLEDTVRSG